MAQAVLVRQEVAAAALAVVLAQAVQAAVRVRLDQAEVVVHPARVEKQLLAIASLQVETGLTERLRPEHALGEAQEPNLACLIVPSNGFKALMVVNGYSLLQGVHNDRM